MDEFKALGKKVEASRNLEWFHLSEDELYSGTTLKVSLECTEFTCRCPVTNQPDWATIYIDYGVGSRIVESKSVKLYMETFRDERVFHEHLAMQILGDFIRALLPRWCKVTAIFNTRGGIAITAKASYDEKPPYTLSYQVVGQEEPIEVDQRVLDEDAIVSTSPNSPGDVPFTQPHWWPT